MHLKRKRQKSETLGTISDTRLGPVVPRVASNYIGIHHTALCMMCKTRVSYLHRCAQVYGYMGRWAEYGVEPSYSKMCCLFFYYCLNSHCLLTVCLFCLSFIRSLVCQNGCAFSFFFYSTKDLKITLLGGETILRLCKFLFRGSNRYSDDGKYQTDFWLPRSNRYLHVGNSFCPGKEM